MRVLQVIAGLHKMGGTTTFVGGLSNALARLGNEVTIATYRKRNPDDEYPLDPQVKVAAVAEIENGSQQFDVVHVHGLWDRDVFWASGWALKHGIPLVWSPHGMLAPWSLKHRWWKKFLPWHLYLKRRLKKAAAIHVTAELEKKWIEELGLGPVVIAPLGTGEFESLKVRRFEGSKVRGFESSKVREEESSKVRKFESSKVREFRVLFVGRVHPVKGLVNLVRAVGEVRKFEGLKVRKFEGLEVREFEGLRVRIVGADDGKHLGELKKLADDLGVADRFEWVGPKYGDDLSEEYDNCDVFVLPSFTENFGGVVVDALAHGKPVIASKFTPWRELEKSKLEVEGEGRGARSRLTTELHTSPSASHFDSFARFKALAEKRPDELAFEEKCEIVRAIEATEVICLELPKDEKRTRLLKGYWDGDANVIRDIVDWGIKLVPVRVINRYIGEIQTHKNSIRSILFHTRFRGPLKVLILERLADVLKDAVLYNKGRDGDETFYNLAHRLRFDPGDGKPVKEFIVRLIVKETAEGNRTWTVEFSNKKELTGMPTTGEAATVEVTHLKSPSTHTILKLLYAVNGVGSGNCSVNSDGQQRGAAPDPNSEKGRNEAVGVCEASGETLVEPVCQPLELLGQGEDKSKLGVEESAARFKTLAEKKVDEWLRGVSRESFVSALGKLVEEKTAAGEYRFRRSEERDLALKGAERFYDEFSRKIIPLSDGRCVYFAPDVRSKARNGNDLSRCWAEYAFHAVSNGGRRIAGKEYNERWYHPHKASNFSQIVQTVTKERCYVRLRDNSRNDSILFYGEVVSGLSFDVVTRLDEFGNIGANLTEVTIEVSSRGEKKPPRLVPLTEAVQTVVHHQTTAGSYPSDAHNISNSLGPRNGLSSSCVGSRAELMPKVDSLPPSPSTSNFASLSRCGWWVDNDPETLAKTLREAMSLSDAERRQMGEVGRKLVEAKYTWSAVAKKMSECYESLKV